MKCFEQVLISVKATTIIIIIITIIIIILQLLEQLWSPGRTNLALEVLQEELPPHYYEKASLSYHEIVPDLQYAPSQGLKERAQ
jgi:hypothetical protein